LNLVFKFALTKGSRAEQVIGTCVKERKSVEQDRIVGRLIKPESSFHVC